MVKIHRGAAAVIGDEFGVPEGRPLPEKSQAGRDRARLIREPEDRPVGLLVLQRPIAVAMVVSGVLAVFLKPLFNDSYIILASLAGMLCAYVVASADATSGQELK